MKTSSLVLVLSLLVTPLAGCAGTPKVADASEVIAMKRSGADDPTIRAWVSAPGRAFDLTDSDIVDLAEAGISEDVMNTMLAKSDEHHEKEGGHEKSHHHEH
ncbi:MAG: hypothetical protein O7F08_14250 [Deltaproteobacteria bacterium]|nr:hypothetical protein [Deltaproteobacteria bacterium]